MLFCMFFGYLYSPYCRLLVCSSFILRYRVFCFRPALVMSVAFYWMQLLLAKYVFLAHKDTTLTLDNRYLKRSGARYSLVLIQMPPTCLGHYRRHSLRHLRYM